MRRAAISGPFLPCHVSLRAGAAASNALDAIAEPNRAALQHLAAFERHRAERCGDARILFSTVEDTRRAFRAVHGRKYGQADLIDEAGTKKGAVRYPAAIYLQTLDAELATEDVERKAEIELLDAGEDVGDAIFPQAFEVRVGDIFSQHDDDGIVTDV